MKHRPGELKEPITINRETLTSDGMGGNTLAINVLHSTRAKVTPMSGRESADFDQLTSHSMYTFVIRRRSGIQENDRITWLGTQYNIRSIPDSGPRDLYLELMAERGVAQ